MRFINFIEPPYKVAIDLVFPLTELNIQPWHLISWPLIMISLDGRRDSYEETSAPSLKVWIVPN